MAEDPFPMSAAELFAQMKMAPENRICVDCRANNPQWASVNLGIFFCLECSGIHRSLGVHISFVRSLTMDAWNARQLRSMQAGGNEKLLAFFREFGVPEDASIEMKYKSNIAELYREKLRSSVEGKSWFPPASGSVTYVPPAPSQPGRLTPGVSTGSGRSTPSVSSTTKKSSMDGDWGWGDNAPPPKNPSPALGNSSAGAATGSKKIETWSYSSQQYWDDKNGGPGRSSPPSSSSSAGIGGQLLRGVNSDAAIGFLKDGFFKLSTAATSVAAAAASVAAETSRSVASKVREGHFMDEAAHLASNFAKSAQTAISGVSKGLEFSAMGDLEHLKGTKHMDGFGGGGSDWNSASAGWQPAPGNTARASPSAAPADGWGSWGDEPKPQEAPRTSPSASKQASSSSKPAAKKKDDDDDWETWLATPGSTKKEG